MFCIRGVMGFPGKVLICLGIFLSTATAAAAATPADIDAAISRAKDYIYSQQHGGNWEIAAAMNPKKAQPDVDGWQWGGLTSIATYSLLAAGEPAGKLTEPVKFLEKADIVGIYALGCRAQVWHLIPPDAASRAAIKRDGMALVKCVQPNGKYDYTTGPAYGFDHSVSQYGVLGVWACAEENLEIPDDYWKKVDAGWRKSQRASGGWAYERGDGTIPESDAMTAAGVATLFITHDELTASVAPDCRGNQTDTAIDRGITWIVAHFDDIFAAGGNTNYTLYGIERIGAAGGLKYLGTSNWYERGADYLVKKQKADGSFPGDLPETCFGLLFLARGRAPVLMNKLQYSFERPDEKPADKPIAGNWNQRPRDVYQFTKWCAAQLELGNFFNWQVVNLQPPVEELHDAPILYIAGDQALRFTPAEEQKLVKFIEQGGMIFFNADCGSAVFSDSVKKFDAANFKQYPFRQLPKDHLIFKNEQYDLSKNPPVVLGVSNGVRELIILLPNADVSRGWQAGQTKTRVADFQLGADVVLYASDKSNLRKRGESYIVSLDPAIATTKSVRMARIQYDGNWDPEPGGWPRLAAILHNSDHIDLQITPVDLTKPDALKGFNIAHLTGTAAPALDDQAWEQLKQFVASGGTLIIDAAGGSDAFAQDMHSRISTAFSAAPFAALAQLEPSNPVYNIPGPEPLKIDYRAFARKKLLDNKTPRIVGVNVGGRTGVFFSAEDLSAGLVGEPVDGINGYSPQAATDLMRAIIRSAVSSPAASTRPAQ